jgi:hypothetical protein
VCDRICRIVTSSPRVRPGTYLPTASSRRSLPSSARSKMAVAVNCFEIEPML